jgi:creatinine amidohydrolase/Fe(II)-dependent formamide hydrolase-like protein
MPRKENRLVGELTFPDVGRRIKPTSILPLPVGAIEQHGPHLPLNIAHIREFAREIVRARPARNLVIINGPCLPFSTCPGEPR